MEQHSAEVAARLERIESALEALTARVAGLESGARVELPAARAIEAIPEPVEPAVVDDDPELKHPMALMGRSMLILGGAFVLRALTESEVLPMLAGVGAGLVYAVGWMLLADRAARHAHSGEAIFDCATAALIAYPMVWETTVRFGLLSVEVASVAVLAISLLLLWVSSRDGLRSVAWIATAGGAATFVALAAGTGSLVAPMIAATSFAAVALVVTGRRGWSYASWPAMAGSDLLALAMLGLALLRRGSHSPSQVIAGLLLFAAIWLAAIVVRGVIARTEPSVVELAQLVEVALAGIGGAALAARLLGASQGGPAWVALLAGAALVGASAIAASRALPELSAACSGVGGLTVLFGSLVLLGRGPATVLWAAIAVASAAIARRHGSTLAIVHAAVWLIAAAVAASMPYALARAFAGVLASPGVMMQLAVVSIAAVAAYVLLRQSSGARLARVGALAIVAGQVLYVLMATVVAAMPSAGTAEMAVGGTAVLAVGATLLSGAARLGWIPEAAVIARVLLGCGGIKLLLQDIRVLNAALLVVSFAIYGCAMLVVARTGPAAEPRPRPLPREALP